MAEQPTYDELAGMIDHAVLAPQLTLGDLDAGSRMARAYGCASACVMPYFVGRCAEIMAGSKTVACCVIGFPHGVTFAKAKAAEAKLAVEAGAAELDMVCNVSLVKSGRWDDVRDDVKAVVDAAAGRAKLKVIFETCYLNDGEKRRLCQICGEAGADWVKTSTGFGVATGGGPTGATDDDLKLMVSSVPPGVQVKASGGVRDLDRLLRVRELGCTRAGASATQKILDAARERFGLDPITVPASGGDGANPTY